MWYYEKLSGLWGWWSQDPFADNYFLPGTRTYQLDPAPPGGSATLVNQCAISTNGSTITNTARSKVCTANGWIDGTEAPATCTVTSTGGVLRTWINVTVNR